jgi:GNAT superfamily N-acetyltransferase
VTSDIRTASIDDAESIGRLLGDAFENDPGMSWCFPDPGVRPRRLEALFGLIASDGYVPVGRSTIVDDTAAALWLPAGTTLGDDVRKPLLEKLAVALEGELERIGTLAGMVGEVHPSDTDHWYLLAIGVRQSAQGAGLGGKLLEHTLRLADARHEPAYLEASSPRNRALYERYGFEATMTLTLPDGPDIWPMWRDGR